MCLGFLLVVFFEAYYRNGQLIPKCCQLCSELSSHCTDCSCDVVGECPYKNVNR